MPHAARFRLRDDDAGAMTGLMVFLFAFILASTGVAIDLMRHEQLRASLQDALDRGVLAAASLTQPMGALATVREYVDSAGFNPDGVNLDADSEGDSDTRRVGAIASFDMSTIFLRMAGYDVLTVGGVSEATQKRDNIEISLALDISGSMARERSGGAGESRLAALRGAAKGFVDAMLAEDDINRSTTITLIPFGGTVNPGPFIFNRLNNTKVHDYSSCIEFTDADFTTTALPASASRAQVPHFQWFRFEAAYGFEADWGWCPTDDKAIVPFSDNATLLKQEIESLVAHDGTGTQNAMKWALGMLDPTTRPIIADMTVAGLVDTEFEDHPKDFNGEGVLKVIVLMTDGNIRYQQRPRPEYYDSSYERQYWASNNLEAFKSYEMTSEQGSILEFYSLCDLAASKNVLVFTIGFDVAEASGAYNEMQTCASSAGHFYHAEGLEIYDAFQSIAAAITKLKLVR